MNCKLFIYFLLSVFSSGDFLKDFVFYFPEVKELEYIQKDNFTGPSSDKFSYFVISKGEREFGYFISNQNNQIVEFSLMPLDIERIERNSEILARKSVGEKRKCTLNSILYLGPTLFLYRYDVYIEDKQVFQLFIDPLMELVVNPSFKKEVSIKDISYTPVKTFSKKIRVEPVKFHINPLSTCLAILFIYWGENGYENLLPKNSYKEIIEELNKLCTSCNISSIIEIFAASKGYTFQTKNITLSPKTIPIIENEISKNRPIIVQVSSTGLHHYGVMKGLLITNSGIFGDILFPTKRQTYQILINLLSFADNITLTIIHPF